MNLSLSGKHAFVCGSTKGIGKAAAQALARLGANITLIARNEAALAATQAALPRSGGQTHDYLQADFSQPEALAASVQAYLADGKTIHILINNTGGPPAGAITEARPEDFLRAFRMHLICNHLLVQAVMPGMKAAGFGRIIQVISTSVREPIPGLGVSNTTRGAVAGWAKTLAGELGAFGITVNNVLPGFTETARLYEIIRLQAQKRGISEEEVAENMKANVPTRRFARAEEVGDLIAFLASPAAGYINGTSIPIDGGRTRCI